MKKHPTHRRTAAALHTGILAVSLALTNAYAAKPVPAAGVDLDIAQFRATPKVDLSSRKGSDISIDIAVRNNGNTDAPRDAILSGRLTPGNNLVFNRRIPLSDAPGGGPTMHTIVPTDLGLEPEPGRIVWTLFIYDDDPDDDTATDATLVTP